MKELLVLRHAKAKKGEPNLKDFDRPLNDIGQAQIPIIANIIKKENLTPDLIISSSSKRTRQTAEEIAKGIGYKKNFIWSKELYECTPFTYIQMLNKLSNSYNNVMLIGHNPTHEEFVNLLCRTHEVLSTGALVCLQLPINFWEELNESTLGKLTGLWRPKDLL